MVAPACSPPTSPWTFPPFQGNSSWPPPSPQPLPICSRKMHQKLSKCSTTESLQLTQRLPLQEHWETQSLAQQMFAWTSRPSWTRPARIQGCWCCSCSILWPRFWYPPGFQEIWGYYLLEEHLVQAGTRWLEKMPQLWGPTGAFETCSGTCAVTGRSLQKCNYDDDIFIGFCHRFSSHNANCRN